MNYLYMTTCTSAKIIKPLFYNLPLTGNILYADGTTLQDKLIPNKPAEKILSSSDGKEIVTNDNKKIILNV